MNATDKIDAARINLLLGELRRIAPARAALRGATEGEDIGV
jgi:hypothetical protein